MISWRAAKRVKVDFFLLLQVSRRQRDFVGYQRQNGAKLYVKPEKDALHHVGPSHSQDAS